MPLRKIVDIYQKHMSQQAPSANQIEQISASYEATLAQVSKLEGELSSLLDYNYEQLEEKMERKEFLQLLAQLMYTLQSATFLYTAVGQKQMPAEFTKVEDYFKRVQTLCSQPAKQPTQKVNKEAVERILKQQL